MSRCPNCFRETMRTKDWACYLCGYPLSSPVYKLIDKTYGEIRHDRLNAKKQPVQVDDQIYEDFEQEIVISKERQSIPLVSEIDIVEKYDAGQDYGTSTEEIISEEPEFKEEIVEFIKATEEKGEETACEDDIQPDSANNEPEETETPECNIEVTDTFVEVQEVSEASDSLIINKPEDTSPVEEEPENIPVQPKIEPIPQADIDITIDELFANYSADHVSATNKYVNKRLRLSGYAAAIDIKEVLAIHYIRLTDASLDVMKSVQCMFDKKYADNLRSLEKGQQITVQGKYTGSLIAMRMADCVLINC
jgi:hypothetical protein